MGNISDDGDINRAWENIKENIKTSAKKSVGLHELKQHKPWFDEECLHFLGERKQAKLPWVQDPSQRNVDIMYMGSMMLGRQKHTQQMQNPQCSDI